MTLEQLSAYKANQYSAKLIEIEIQRMEAQYKQLCKPSYIGASKLDGMPRGNIPSDPTARIGVQVADDYIPPDALHMLEAIASKKVELQECLLKISYVDAWLECLTGVERWVIRMHLIERYTWRTVAFKSAQELWSVIIKV